MAIKLEVRAQGGWHRYTGSFSTEEQALAFMSDRGMTHSFGEIEEFPIPDTATRLLDTLYPTCHHGMDGRMCLDPYGDNHFGSAEWERAQYGSF